MEKLEWHNERRKVSELIPYEHNPRQISEKQVSDLKKSLERFNLVEVPAIDTDNKIIAGHQRLKIMQALGRGDEEIDVRVPNRKLTDKEFQEYNIRSNKNTAEWDFDILANSFEVGDLLEWGFDEKELKIDREIDEDEVPATPDAPVAQLGDLYKLGDHRLLCGDATKKEDVERLMNGQQADMVFTDPPYNVDYRGMGSGGRWDAGIENDNMSDSAFSEFLNKVFENYSNFTVENAAIYVCHSDKMHKEFRSALDATGFEWRATIIWMKNSPAFNFAQYKYQHEPIFYAFKKGKTVNWYGDFTNSTMWDFGDSEDVILKKVKKAILSAQKEGRTTIWQEKKESGDHPTIKPIALIARALENSSISGNSVIDLFGGSGSTLIACEQLKRKCYMMELEPKYIDVIIKRWENLTGQKAEKI